MNNENDEEEEEEEVEEEEEMEEEENEEHEEEWTRQSGSVNSGEGIYNKNTLLYVIIFSIQSMK